MKKIDEKKLKALEKQLRKEDRLITANAVRCILDCLEEDPCPHGADDCNVCEPSKKEKPYKRSCLWCQEKFQPQNKNHVYCNENCAIGFEDNKTTPKQTRFKHDHLGDHEFCCPWRPEAMMRKMQELYARLDTATEALEEMAYRDIDKDKNTAEFGFIVRTARKALNKIHESS